MKDHQYLGIGPGCCYIFKCWNLLLSKKINAHIKYDNVCMFSNDVLPLSWEKFMTSKRMYREVTSRLDSPEK